MLKKLILGALGTLFAFLLGSFFNILTWNFNVKNTTLDIQEPKVKIGNIDEFIAGPPKVQSKSHTEKNSLDLDLFDLIEIKRALKSLEHSYFHERNIGEVAILFDSEGKEIIKYLIKSPEKEILDLNSLFKSRRKSREYKKKSLRKGNEKYTKELIEEWINGYRITETVGNKLKMFEEIRPITLEQATETKLIEPQALLDEVFLKHSDRSRIVNFYTNYKILKLLQNPEKIDLEEDLKKEMEVRIELPIEYVNFTLNKEGELLDKEHYLDLNKKKVFKAKIKLIQVFKSFKEFESVLLRTQNNSKDKIADGTLKWGFLRGDLEQTKTLKKWDDFKWDLEQTKALESSIKTSTTSEYNYYVVGDRIYVRNLRINLTTEELDQQTEEVKEKIESLYKSLAIKAVRQELLNLARKDKKLDNKIKSYLKEKKEL